MASTLRHFYFVMSRHIWSLPVSPPFHTTSSNTSFIFIPDFINTWREFVSSPNERDPPTSISNKHLLCEHSGLAVKPSITFSHTDSSYICVNETEWRNFSTRYTADHEIYVLYDSSSGLNESHPKICEGCLKSRFCFHPLIELYSIRFDVDSCLP
jgi:hypothetical protein